MDYRLTPTQSIFARFNLQDDTINAAPQFPGLAPRSSTLTDNLGFAIGYDNVLSSSLVNSFRYGLTRIDTSSVGLIKANYTTFRFIDSIRRLHAHDRPREPDSQHRERPVVAERKHTLKVGANLRFSRIPSTRDSNSWLTATVNPSWVSGVGRTYAPGGANCSTPGCSQVPAVASGFAAGYADAWLNILGVLSQANLARELRHARATFSRSASRSRASTRPTSTTSTCRTAGAWDRASRVTAGLRYGLYSPPYEVNGLQVAPTISMGQWFDERAAGMSRGVPSNASPIVTFDLAGPKNGGRGFYEWTRTTLRRASRSPGRRMRRTASSGR